MDIKFTRYHFITCSHTHCMAPKSLPVACPQLSHNFQGLATASSFFDHSNLTAGEVHNLNKTNHCEFYVHCCYGISLFCFQVILGALSAGLMWSQYPPVKEKVHPKLHLSICESILRLVLLVVRSAVFRLKLQWNPSITDTLGTQNFVHYNEVSLSQGFWYISGRRGMHNRALSTTWLRFQSFPLL